MNHSLRILLFQLIFVCVNVTILSIIAKITPINIIVV